MAVHTKMKVAGTPFFSNYRPQVFTRTTDVTGSIELLEGTEMVMPGDNATFAVKLINPIAVEVGQKFPSRRRKDR